MEQQPEKVILRFDKTPSFDIFSARNLPTQELLIEGEKDIELQCFLSGNLTIEKIDSLKDIEILKTLLKQKCREIKILEEKMKSFTEVLKTNKANFDLENSVIRMQTKVINKYNSIMNESKQSIENPEKNKDAFLKEDTTKLISLAGDSNIFENTKNMDLIRKKWFSNKKKLSFDPPDLDVEIQRIIPEFCQQNEFPKKEELNFIEISIRNASYSDICFYSMRLDSTESKIFRNIPFSYRLI